VMTAAAGTGALGSKANSGRMRPDAEDVKCIRGCQSRRRLATASKGVNANKARDSAAKKDNRSHGARSWSEYF